MEPKKDAAAFWVQCPLGRTPGCLPVLAFALSPGATLKSQKWFSTKPASVWYFSICSWISYCCLGPVVGKKAEWYQIEFSYFDELLFHFNGFPGLRKCTSPIRCCRYNVEEGRQITESLLVIKRRTNRANFINTCLHHVVIILSWPSSEWRMFMTALLHSWFSVCLGILP